MDGLYVGPSSGSLPPDPEGLGAYAESLDSSLKFTSWGDSTWQTSSDFPYQYYHDGDAVQSGDADSGTESVLQAIVESDSSETIKFWWKSSCDSYSDFLKFYIDGTYKDQITGDEDWQEESFAVSSGIHTLKWVFTEGGTAEDDYAWVDFVQWTGPGRIKSVRYFFWVFLLVLMSTATANVSRFFVSSSAGRRGRLV